MCFASPTGPWAAQPMKAPIEVATPVMVRTPLGSSSMYTPGYVRVEGMGPTSSAADVPRGMGKGRRPADAGRGSPLIRYEYARRAGRRPTGKLPEVCRRCGGTWRASQGQLELLGGEPVGLEEGPE